MFTPQRRPPSTTFTPRSEKPRKSSIAEAKFSSREKGKAVASVDGPALLPPPVRSLTGVRDYMETDDTEDWKRFREAGLLNEADLERRDREALMEKASRLEKELYDYQYTMGLLLMEKKEWNSKYDQLGEAVAEVQEILKREHLAHVIAISEVEKREEMLKEALRTEKQHVHDLQKSLRDLQEEHGQIKQSSDMKLADVKALVVGIEEKSMNVDKMMRSTESKLAEANKKSLEMDIKLQELESRENTLQRERLMLTMEREAHKANLYRQREELLEWEKKLQEREERLSDLRRTLTSREEKANESDEIFKIKETEVEEIKKKVDISSSKLRKRDDDVNNQISNLTVKQKEVDSMGSTLEIKEEELLALEEKLSAREKMESQQLCDDHQSILNAKLKELELELDDRRKNFHGDLRTKLHAVEQQQAELLHREDKLGKRELALAKRTERQKEKGKDIDANMKSLKERERSLKAEQKKFDLEKKQLLADKESLQTLQDDCKKIRAEIAQQQMQIAEERENLKVANDKRTEHLLMQAEFEHQLEKCRQEKELIQQESENLKLEREKFEKEWELLGDKRDEISKTEKEIANERHNLERMQFAEHERLQKVRCAMEDEIQRQLEAVHLEKESFEARKRQEQLVLSKSIQSAHDQIVSEFGLQKNNFEVDLAGKREEMEKDMHERERLLDERKEVELNHIMHLEEVTQRELEEIKSERCALEKENQVAVEQKQKLEEQQIGLIEDIKELQMLSKKLCDQREQVSRERNHFLAFVEKLKSCNGCGESLGKFVLSDLNPPDVEQGEAVFLPKLADDILRKNRVSPSAHAVLDRSPIELDPGNPHSGGPMSWLRKCTSMILSLSPIKKNISDESLKEELPSITVPVDAEDKVAESRLLDLEGTRGPAVAGDDTRLIFATADAVDVHHPQSDSLDRQGNGGQKGRRWGRSGIGRTRSVKEVVEDAAVFLGESLKESEYNSSVQPDVGNIIDDTRDSHSHNEKATGNTARKRQRAISGSEHAADDSEGHLESATTGGRRKRQQRMASAAQTLGQKRYNLRPHKTAGTTPHTRATTRLDKEGNEQSDGDADVEREDLEATKQAVEPGKTLDLVHVTVHKNIEISQHKVGEFETVDVEHTDNSQAIETMEMSEEVNDLKCNLEYKSEGESASTISGDSGDNNEDDDAEHLGEASIGKKLWTFFTT